MMKSPGLFGVFFTALIYFSAAEPNNGKPCNPKCVPYYLCKHQLNATNSQESEESKDKCPNYAVMCCTPTVRLDPHDQDYTPSCGRSNSDGIFYKISSNENNEAQYLEFPWMMAILKHNNENDPRVVWCGGSLIHPQVVLTATHCVNNFSVNSLYVRAGEWDLQDKTELYPVQERDVKKIILHEGFVHKSGVNDIALLVLKSPFKLTPAVDILCLPGEKYTIDDQNCIATGWGKDVFGSEGQYQRVLKKVKLPIVSRRSCEATLRDQKFGQGYNLHDSLLCAGGNPGEDTCTGDGGGPLMCPYRGEPNKFVQVGVTAWGIRCGSRLPGVYADVTNLKRWIDEKMLKNNFSYV